MEAEDTYLEELESRERRALNAEKLLQEARLQIIEEKQRVEQVENKLFQSIQRMRQAGLSDADICTFLNISTAELSQMTSFSNDE